MSEDYEEIQAEIAEALVEVADVSHPNGYPAVLRTVEIVGGDDFNPGSGEETIVYATIYCLESEKEVKDQTGTLIDQKNRSLMVAADGPVPTDEAKVLLGSTADDLNVEDDATYAWESISTVITKSKSGVTLYYTLILET